MCQCFLCPLLQGLCVRVCASESGASCLLLYYCSGGHLAGRNRTTGVHHTQQREHPRVGGAWLSARRRDLSR